MSTHTDIAVVGLSVEVPDAPEQHAFWDIVREGRSLTRPFPAGRRRELEEYVRCHQESALVPDAAERVDFHEGSFLDRIDLFDHEFFGMTPKQAAVTDPHQRLVLRTMYRALEDAGYTGDRLTGSRTGVYIGYAGNPGMTYLDYFCRVDPSLGQLGITGNIVTMLANRLSYLYDLRGPSMVLDSACSASLVALHQAKSALLLGDCEMAVVAGTRVVLAPLRHPHTRIGIESSDGVTRTFDERADGTGFGEGSGALVLKRLDRALADGDQVYAVIKGSAVNHDGHSEMMTAPDAGAQADLLDAAWRDAGVDPRSIGYLEVHGTATKVGDPIEFEGLRRAFAARTEDRRFCAVGTVKANVGHLFEGSGVLGVIKAVLALRHRVIPPLANYERPNGSIDLAEGPVYVPTEAREWTAGDGPRRAGVSAFGLGGTNAHVVLEEFTGARADTEPAARAAGAAGVAGVASARATGAGSAAAARTGSTGATGTGSPTVTGTGSAGAAEARPSYLFTLSARTRLSLARLIRRYREALDAGRIEGGVRDVCWTANVSRAHHAHRFAVTVADLDGLRTALATAEAGEEPEAARTEAARAWTRGAEVDLSAAYEGQRPRTVHLPPYEFDETRAWVDFPDDWRERFALAAPHRTHPVTHEVRFVPAPLAESADPSVRVLALAHPGTAGTVAEALPPGTVLRAPDDPAADPERLTEELVDEGYTHLVHALALDESPAQDPAELSRRIEEQLTGLFHLARELMRASAELDLVVLTRRGLAVGPGEPGTVAEHAALAGFAKAVAREYPYMTVTLLDLDETVPAPVLRQEILAAEPGVYALRGKDKYRESFAELAEVPAVREEYLRPGGAYLITGGLGALGLEMARHFAARAPGLHLYLLGRTALPPEEEWDTLAAGSSHPAAARISAVRALTALGARVHPVAADAADEEALSALLETIRAAHGRLDGIVHAAGVAGGDLIARREDAAFDSVVRPKLHGAFLLHHLTREDRPDFVLHMSSVAAVFPALGQGDYAAANFYLDHLARALNTPEHRVVSVQWVAWREIGMAVATNFQEDASFRSLRTRDGLALVDAALRGDLPGFFGGGINYDSELMSILPTYPLALSTEIEEKIATALADLAERGKRNLARVREAIEATEVRLTGNPDGVYSEREWMVARCLAHTLGHSSIDVHTDFRDLGLDSMMALTVGNSVSACLGRQFDTVNLITDRTVVDVARLVESRYGADARDGSGLPGEPGADGEGFGEDDEAWLDELLATPGE
ncbi:SDR family NAD(P)-dependent oxidoreductase [Streptomyces sp. ME02-6978.2a]|uniref:SDR family NAD(P)-dependent oxidoreductase n=1 Tax=Streptomyces sp. ME02-6978.2a TaxID=462922 RepID=UPI0029ABA027|nr:SDR family NAD(P)-dependent oxidoreductase [Streptomyces sp. ME02-6978.2a]MDX3360850.1 SDR family NAD(P)-dependent oxidoreductase [Streptomyces sp. ME02-6978.2a]